jgi:small GTP-binding protein
MSSYSFSSPFSSSKVDSGGYDFQYSILILGDSNTGKSSLLTKYVHNTYSKKFEPTIGIDFKIKSVFVNDLRIKLRIWDTAGQEKFRTITNSYYRGVQGAIICYSVENRDSFHNISHWHAQISLMASPDVVIVIVGTKCDSANRTVSEDEGARLAADLNASFCEVSSLSGSNVDTLFTEITNQVHDIATGAIVVAPPPPSTPVEAEAGAEALGKLAISAAAAAAAVATSSSSSSSTSRSSAHIQREKLLQTACEVRVSGATSWFNRSKVNGRYVPQVSAHGQLLLEVGRFCYFNVDAPSTVMVFRKNHWVIRVNNKDLAQVPSSSITCFPDDEALRGGWLENHGVYFKRMYPAPGLRCVVMGATRSGGGGGGSGGGDGDERRISIANIFGSSFKKKLQEEEAGAGAGASSNNRKGGSGESRYRNSDYFAGGDGGGGGGSNGEDDGEEREEGGGRYTITVEQFLQYSKAPEQVGLSLPLFVQCCRIKVALLELEHQTLEATCDYVTMAEIRIQKAQIESTCKALESTIQLPLPLPLLRSTRSVAPAAAAAAAAPGGKVSMASQAGVEAALEQFLQDLSAHYEQLCDPESGNFEAARRCRQTQSDMEEALAGLREAGCVPGHHRESLVVLEGLGLLRRGSESESSSGGANGGNGATGSGSSGTGDTGGGVGGIDISAPPAAAAAAAAR